MKCRVKKFGALFAAGSALVFSLSTSAQAPVSDQGKVVIFFDVSEVPARIDEPRLTRTNDKYELKCTIANRDSDQLLGLRLILLIVDGSGKLRSRTTWSETNELAAYSLRPLLLHPEIKERLRDTDRPFLVVDEVIGHERIWQVEDAEKALRAYARGQHDTIPKVRIVANKFDRPLNGPIIVPLRRK